MPAAVGTEVSIGPYDTEADVHVGDGLVSDSTGRAYLIVAARPVTRGRHVGHRWHLRAVVVDQLPTDCPTAHRIVWYRRQRKACTVHDRTRETTRT